MSQRSNSQVKSEIVTPPISSASDLEVLDIDTPPETYMDPGNPALQNTPKVVAHNRTSTLTKTSDRRPTSVMQSPSNQPSRTLDQHQQQSTSRQSTPKKQSSRILGLFSMPRSDSVEPETEHQAQADEISQLKKLLHEKEDAIKSMSERHMNDLARQQQAFTDDWQYRERETEQHYRQIEFQNHNTIQSLQVQVQELASHQTVTQDKYNTLIRRQQEESFKRMETARWLPREHSRVLADFESTRTKMRAWAKVAAVKNLAAMQDVEEVQRASLLTSLSCVVVLEDNQLPRGLSTPKGPSLLLNALLAHDLYTSLFQSPFFFLSDVVYYGPTGYGLDDALGKIYDLALACKWEVSSHRDYLLKDLANVEDAHTWRSQTLRLLLPQLRAGNTDGEKNLHQRTEEMIAKVAEQCASQFAASSARYLIDNNTANIKKLNSIYQEAASISYMLWTRKTAMTLETLREMRSPTFDVDDSRLKPHALVHPDDHDDKLKGRQITLVVHPLLQVYGTDEGKDYDKARVWVPAEVWFDTK